ncbi:PQQ-dependent sugar dehydrogenase, partial [Streptomyces goshikiensis]|uniref:PQQ-dependent sugar dehydrogenase n=1 Tax=Streptomyces goshikiensis TaxID=1942 RepID=UPI0033FE408E
MRYGRTRRKAYGGSYGPGRYEGRGARGRGVLAATALAGCGALLAAGCGPATGGAGPAAGSSPPPTAGAPSPGASGSSPASAPPARGSVTVSGEIAKGLESPWGVAPLPDGDLLVASRDKGTISRVRVSTGEVTPIGRVPGVAPGGEGGLLGLALSPGFASDRMVYAYFTTESDNRIARMRYDERRDPGQQL